MKCDALVTIVDKAVGALYGDPEQVDVLTEEEIAAVVEEACQATVKAFAGELLKRRLGEYVPEGYIRAELQEWIPVSPEKEKS